MQKFSQDLKEIYIKLINNEQKLMITLTDKKRKHMIKKKCVSNVKVNVVTIKPIKKSTN